jgi:hypothetical protein
MLLVLLPCLMGSIKPPCDPLGSDAIEATVTSVEQATYTCDVKARDSSGGALNRCVEASSGLYAGTCVLTLRGSDSSTRTGTTYLGATATGTWCNVPAGHYDITLCTPRGALPCTVDVAENDHEVSVQPLGSLPYPRRFHARTDRALPDGSYDLVFDDAAVDLDLPVGARVALRLRSPYRPVLELEACDLQAPRTPTQPAPGCGRCDGAGLDPSVIGLVVFVLAIPSRRRRR